MSRMSVGTPCPAPNATSNLPLPVPGRRLSTTSLGTIQDDTEQIDYTRAIQVEFKNAKPRRRSTFQHKEKKEAAVTIFEDVLEDEELVVESRPQIGGSTLLGKRPQKMPGRAPFRKQESEVEAQQQPLQVTGQARRRSSVAFQAAIHENEPEPQPRALDIENERPAEQSKEMKKEPRRRTIFVPPDDTTVMTIHPGANTTDRLNDTFQLPNLDLKLSRVQVGSRLTEEHKTSQPVKRPRMSLAAAPKRVPLQQVTSQDANRPGIDTAGKNGGKENMPPNAKAAATFGATKVTNATAKFEKSTVARSSLHKPTAASRNRQSNVPRNTVPLSKPSANASRLHETIAEKPSHTTTAGSTIHTRPNRQSILFRNDLKHQPSPTSDNASDDSKPKTLRPRLKPVERKVARLQQYPVLLEDIAQPELYEDSWLGHQEVALSELINQIFRTAERDLETWQNPKVSLREQLISIYHQQNVTTLHKRLQASLLYGALSRPRDGSKPPNPAHDIGLRKRFLSFWLDSYDQEGLHAAAEVVFGHQLPKQARSSAGNEGTLDPHKGRRTLIGFLETFLVEVEDAEEPDEERRDDPNGRWRKIILRSLMLIWLLDQAKASQAVRGCLFKRNSPRKTSVSMLHGLVSTLIPSIGDITRVLRHLDYEVLHIQDPLDEVHYRVDNIAVDLRDGILLTRLVELLLFLPDNARARNAAADATVTIQMPDLTILESALYDTEGGKCPRILSQHLKMPCLGRTQKVYNLEVAISAVHNHGRLGDGALDVTATDIVDGHREKTLSLLWSLVSTHGLEQLVAFQELSADIRRTASGTADVDGLPNDCNHLSQLQQESLLKKWASVYCAQNGVRIGNLTTSFADGKAYAAILGAFAGYMPVKSNYRSSSPKADSRLLEIQLHSFGCSTAFVKQLTSSCGTIPSRKTTISNLAFLASRLLPLATNHNAVMTIQRAFRRKQARITASRRIALMRLAHACASIVQTQNRLISAAEVLQRSWRRVLDARIVRLNSDVEKFQAVAQGWTLRLKTRRDRSGVLSNSQSLRVMGGW